MRVARPRHRTRPTAAKSPWPPAPPHWPIASAVAEPAPSSADSPRPLACGFSRSDAPPEISATLSTRSRSAAGGALAHASAQASTAIQRTVARSRRVLPCPGTPTQHLPMREEDERRHELRQESRFRLLQDAQHHQRPSLARIRPPVREEAKQWPLQTVLMGGPSMSGRDPADRHHLNRRARGNRDQRGRPPAIGPKLAVSSPASAGPLSQDPAKARQFRGGSGVAAAEPPRPQKGWRSR